MIKNEKLDFSSFTKAISQAKHEDETFFEDSGEENFSKQFDTHMSDNSVKAKDFATMTILILKRKTKRIINQLTTENEELK